MASYPVTHCMGGRDKRYTVAKEFCGYAEARYVARFCGEWIGQSKFPTSAAMLAIGEAQRRAGALVIEAKES